MDDATLPPGPRDDDPAPDAYGRVTGAVRFAPLHGVARGLIARLQAAYDVEVADATEELRRERPAIPVLDAVRITPRAGSGTSLVVGLSPFPGVSLRFGRNGSAAFPTCGCDACDEQVKDEADELRALVDDVVEGRVEEEVRRGPGTAELTLRRPGRAGTTYLYGGEAEAEGEPWRRTWGPWPRR
ncbi:DUF6226 family protein [Motilibacter deserti]|uniref:Uncharacterized protein n=1 Tax=Motilibacter deserti TaxID=2714956 RepID=A0ABX0GUU5_9ACTN|nr:hypothetical protein [Motilibacter deserti]